MSGSIPGMRASLLLPRFVIAAVIASCGALVACGSSKPPPAADPSADPASGARVDETPKWEGATNPTGNSSSASSSSASGSSGATGDPKPKGRDVQEGATRRSDQYDKEATEVVLKRAARQVKENCGAAKDDNGKATGPWGKANLQIQLGHNGRSKGITVPSPYQGKVTGNCIEKAFANLTYPPWGGQDAQVDWEVELVQPAADPPTKK